jgi:hypothetical protein
MTVPSVGLLLNYVKSSVESRHVRENSCEKKGKTLLYFCNSRVVENSKFFCVGTPATLDLRVLFFLLRCFKDAQRKYFHTVMTTNDCSLLRSVNMQCNRLHGVTTLNTVLFSDENIGA